MFFLRSKIKILFFCFSIVFTSCLKTISKTQKRQKMKIVFKNKFNVS